MTTKSEIVRQTNLAFDFIEKLYLEVSYLVKEIEGILGEEEEKFIIGRPSGYGVNTIRSTSLESNYVLLWFLRKFSVFFVPEDKTKIKGGQSFTRVDKDLKILYLRILLNDRDVRAPEIYSGVLYDIQLKPQSKWKKFESAMNYLEYRGDQIFKDVKPFHYDHAYISFHAKLIKNDLFEINDSENILKKIIKPSLELYRTS